MNFKSVFYSLLFVLVVVGCKDKDPEPSVQLMTLMNRSTGDVSQINLSTGEMTSLGNFTINGGAVIGIRDFVYNSSDDMIYACQDNNRGGKILKIDPSTKEATVINENTNVNWDAVAEMVVSSGKLLCTNYDNLNNYGLSLVEISTAGVVENNYQFKEGDLVYDSNPGMGLCFNSSKTGLMVGSGLDMLSTSKTGVISEATTVTYSGFPANTSNGSFGGYIQSLERGSDGKVYAIVSLITDLDAFVQCFASYSGGTMTYISTLNTSGIKYLGLTNLPESVF